VTPWGTWNLPESELHVLGEVASRDILELGCGAAQGSIDLARAGARPIGARRWPAECIWRLRRV
jgi:predicted nicotinamide N-methyase